MAQQETIEQKADRLYRFIYEHFKKHARGPSHREMTQSLNLSTETIQKLLNHLEETGRAIHRIRGRGRRLLIPIE